jgi:hypothetical protein
LSGHTSAGNDRDKLTFVCAIVLMVVIAMGGATIGRQALTGSRLARLTVGLVLMLAPIGSAIWLGGCSGGSAPPKTATYTLIVTATVDGSAQTATLTLTVD